MGLVSLILTLAKTEIIFWAHSKVLFADRVVKELNFNHAKFLIDYYTYKITLNPQHKC